jgi:hypothetical protein
MNQAELHNFSKIILQKLTAELKNGRINAQNPAKGQDLITGYNKKFGSDYKLPDLREAINYLRCQGEPIGSNAGSDGGYFYCANEAEWLPVRADLIERQKAQQRAIDAVTLRYQRDRDKEIFPELRQPAQAEHSVVKALQDKFGAIPIQQ